MVDLVAIKAPDYGERERFFQVYNTGLPFVDRMSPEKFNAWWDKSSENGNLEKLWRVAHVSSEIVGVVINIVNRTLRMGMVWELAVIPEMRDKGIGRRLIEESEKLLIDQPLRIKTFGIGAKTDNIKAIALYERLGYQMKHLILNLRGKKWKPRKSHGLSVRRPEKAHLPELVRLTPDAYWDAYDTAGWRDIIRDDKSRVVVEKETGEILGHVRLLPAEGNRPATEIPVHFRPGHGVEVIEACLSLVDTENVEFWVEDRHGDVVDHLYRRGLTRSESEFLLTKESPKKPD